MTTFLCNNVYVTNGIKYAMFIFYIMADTIIL